MVFQKAQKNPVFYFWSSAVFITILSLASLLPSLSDSLWIDEPFSANMTVVPWGEFFTIFLNDPATPLYYIILKLWASIFGDSELALHSFSAVCFVLTLLTVGLTALETGGIFAGLAALLLAAINNVGLVFASIARPYALLSMLTAVSTLLFFILVGLIQVPISRQKYLLLATGFTTINVLGLLTHPIFIFYMIGCNTAALLLCRRKFWHITLFNLVAGVFFLALWGPYVYRTLGLPAVSWMETPDLQDLIHAYVNLWGVKKTILLVSFILLASSLNFISVRNFVFSRLGLISLTILLLMSVLPFLVSQYRVIFNDTRTPSLFYPLACVFLALLLERFRNLWLTFGLLVLMFGYITAAPIFTRGGRGTEPSPKTSVRYAVENANCGDVFVSGGLSFNEISYYMRQLRAPDCIQNKVFPGSIHDHPGWMDPSSSLDQHRELAKEADALIEDLDKKLGTNGRLWFFYETNDNHQYVVDILQERLDQNMTLTRTIEGHGSFFDKILIYASKH